MGMSFGGIAREKVATVIVAADGTGDTPDISTGIGLLPAGGGVVYIKEGTYTITSAITIDKDNVALIGAGKATKIQTTSDINMISGTSKDGIYISQIYLYGAGSGKTSNDGINFNNVTTSVIENSWIENCGNLGLNIRGNSFALIIDSNNILSNISNGIIINFSGPIASYIKITNNDIRDNKIGIYLVKSLSNIIKGNSIRANIDDGIRLLNSHDNVISGNIIKDNDVNNSAGHDGIFIDSSSDDNVIVNNRCQNNDRYEINISGATCSRNIVMGNNCIGTDHVGAINDAGTNTHPNGASGTTNLALDDLNIIA